MVFHHAKSQHWSVQSNGMEFHKLLRLGLITAQKLLEDDNHTPLPCVGGGLLESLLFGLSVCPRLTPNIS